MNKLIKSAMMMASVGAMLCIVGCGADAPKENSPKAAAIESAKVKFAKHGGDALSYEVGIVKMHPDGDKAIVDVKVSGEYNGASGSETLHIDVKKVNGNWVAE